jgi:hypothetical protein
MQYVPQEIFCLVTTRDMLSERCCVAKRLKANNFRAAPGAELQLNGQWHRERA